MERSNSGDDIVTILEALINVHGATGFVRMDNGTEMTSNTVADSCRSSLLEISIIELGSPWQNTSVKSCAVKYRGDLLKSRYSPSVRSEIIAENYRQDYNQIRPLLSLGYKIPNEFKKTWDNNNQDPTTIPAN